jgi:ATP-independent RNA helicase DbpA
MNKNSFSALKIPKSMINNLTELEFIEMTPIQADALPHILEDKDVIAQAKTGSGKTVAFGIGVVNKIEISNPKTQSIILCPTRELADQITKELRKLARSVSNLKVLTISGGVPYKPQVESLKHGAHIVVGTPGRILKHLNKNTFNLEFLKVLVLDEAHRMLDMGFIEEITKVIKYAPKKRQTLLFSATYTDEIIKLSSSIQKDAVNIQTISTEKPNDISEYFFKTSQKEKTTTLLRIFSTHKPKNVIIFTNTKAESQNIATFLKRKGIDALAINGDLEQFQRTDVLIQFLNESCSVMVATDVAARGIDIDDLSMVINYELPHDKETYTHRIGRTGRAGKSGLAITLYLENESYKADHYKNNTRIFSNIDILSNDDNFKLKAPNTTIVIEAGKKNKIRVGDILGALTKEVLIDSKYIGKIDLYDNQSFVAINRSVLDDAFNGLKNGKIKNKNVPVWIKNNF